MSLVASLLTVLFGGDVPSGPMVGDKLPEFKVLGFSGPSEGKEFELVKGAKDKPILVVVVHKITRPALQLMRPIDDFATKEEKLATQFVWLGEKEKMEGYLKRAKGSLNIQSPMSIALDKDGPMTYGLNDRATITILLAKEGKVVANFAFADPNATNARPVLQAIRKALGKAKK